MSKDNLVIGHYDLTEYGFPKATRIPMPPVKPPKPDGCTYTLVDDDSNTWECSNCRDMWNLMNGTPEDNYMNFCPHCGVKIIESKIKILEGMDN